jgi:hypothetical protein
MPLDRWLDDQTLQAIAAENNLSETAFAVPSDPEDADYDLRWFTPTVEVDFAGMRRWHPTHFADRRKGAVRDPSGVLTSRATAICSISICRARAGAGRACRPDGSFGGFRIGVPWAKRQRSGHRPARR